MTGGQGGEQPSNIYWPLGCGGDQAYLEILMVTHAGMTTAEFEAIARAGPLWTCSGAGRSFTVPAYQQMRGSVWVVDMQRGWKIIYPFEKH